MATKIKKQAVVIYYEKKPLFICAVQDFSANEYVQLRDECLKNHAQFLIAQTKKENELNEKIARLEQRIKVLEGVE